MVVHTKICITENYPLYGTCSYSVHSGTTLACTEPQHCLPACAEPQHCLPACAEPQHCLPACAEPQYCPSIACQRVRSPSIACQRVQSPSIACQRVRSPLLPASVYGAPYCLLVCTEPLSLLPACMYRALAMAAGLGLLAMVELLLSHGSTDEGAVHQAAANGHPGECSHLTHTPSHLTHAPSHTQRCWSIYCQRVLLLTRL